MARESLHVLLFTPNSSFGDLLLAEAKRYGVQCTLDSGKTLNVRLNYKAYDAVAIDKGLVDDDPAVAIALVASFKKKFGGPIIGFDVRHKDENLTDMLMAGANFAVRNSPPKWSDTQLTACAHELLDLCQEIRLRLEEVVVERRSVAA